MIDGAAAFEAYVICTAPRSGSTLLCKLLAATGVAGAPRSYFHEPSVDSWLEGLGVAPETAAAPLARLETALRAAIAKGRGTSEIFGLRLQRHSARFFLQQLALLHPDAGSDSARIEAAFGRTAFVHLRRRDRLGQAISYVKARQTGLWHAAPDGRELERLSPPRPPRYDAAAIRAQIAEFEAFDAAWEDWFATEGVAPLRLVYEDLAADPPGVLRGTLARLGLDSEAAAGARPEVARLSDAVNADWAARFRAEQGDA